MSQEQYLSIVRCIQFGAAARAEELIGALNGMITKCKSYERKEKAQNTTKETKKN